LIAAELGINRSTLSARIDSLVAENYFGSFRILKGKKTKIFMPREALPILKEWKVRSAWKLLNVLKGGFHTSKDSAQKSKATLETLLSDDKANEKDIFSNLINIRNFVTERLFIGDIELINKNLFWIYKYMKRYKYDKLLIDKPYSIGEVESILGARPSSGVDVTSELFDSYKLFEFIITQRFSSIIDSVMSRRRISDPDAYAQAEKTLQWAIKKYDPTKGNFNGFASFLIDRHLSGFKSRTRSLEENISEDYTLKEVIPAIDVHSVLELLDTLDESQRFIVEEYLGLSNNGKNFDEIASKLNISKSKVKQMYKDAITKLRNNAEESFDEYDQ